MRLRDHFEYKLNKPNVLILRAFGLTQKTTILHRLATGDFSPRNMSHNA